MPTLEDKRANALDAVNQLIALLERCREYNWAGKFYPIKDALEALDDDRAFLLYTRIPMPNMGGFLDLLLSEVNGHTVRNYHRDNDLLDQLRDGIDRTLLNLHDYLYDETDRPLVDIPDGH